MKSFFLFTVMICAFMISNAQTKMFINRTGGTDSIALSDIKSISFKNVPTPPVSNDSLLAFWLFSGNARDTSGKGNHGTVMGAILSPDRFGKPNNAYNFTNGYIQVNSSSNLDPRDISLCAWVNSAGTTSLNQFILNRENQYQLIISPENKLCWSLWGNTTWGYDTTGISLTPNSWSFVVITYDGVNVKAYLNGILKYTRNYNQGKIVAQTGVLRIGKRSYGYETSNIFNGLIDDVRIYKRVLTDTEIQSLYNAQ